MTMIANVTADYSRYVRFRTQRYGDLLGRCGYVYVNLLVAIKQPAAKHEKSGNNHDHIFQLLSLVKFIFLLMTRDATCAPPAPCSPVHTFFTTFLVSESFWKNVGTLLAALRKS